MSDLNKENIIRDFSAKRSTYFQSNYGVLTASNFLRSIRRGRIVDAALEKATDGSVLDAGCGPAILYPEVLERCKKYTAMDLTPANLEEIKSKNDTGKVELCLQDLDSFQAGDRRYDVIICSGALEYTSQPLRNIVELANALAPQGKMVCSLPNLWSPYRLWIEKVYIPVRHISLAALGRSPNRYLRNLFSSASVMEKLQSAGFKVVIHYFGGKFIPTPLDSLFATADFKLTQRFEKKKSSFLSPYFSEFLLEIERS